MGPIKAVSRSAVDSCNSSTMTTKLYRLFVTGESLRAATRLDLVAKTTAVEVSVSARHVPANDILTLLLRRRCQARNGEDGGDGAAGALGACCHLLRYGASVGAHAKNRSGDAVEAWDGAGLGAVGAGAGGSGAAGRRACAGA